LQSKQKPTSGSLMACSSHWHCFYCCR